MTFAHWVIAVGFIAIIAYLLVDIWKDCQKTSVHDEPNLHEWAEYNGQLNTKDED